MIFITFEGPEGSGKSTQIRLLEKYLIKKGLTVVNTREPGGSMLAEKIRKLLLNSANISIAPPAELLLYLASRAQHVNDKIKPALEKGQAVICDRFSDSTMAYQGYARGLSKKMIKEMNEFAAYGLKPDLTIYIDIDVNTGLRRAHKRSGKKDRLESEKTAFHKKVRKGYLEIAESEPLRIKIINGKETVGQIQKKIADYVDILLNKRPGLC
jgi:dTMP kinase